ncbi:hypothetical protein [Halobacillus litoralis]|nr:hypothetical protein [Halobacillus litoralis]
MTGKNNKDKKFERQTTRLTEDSKSKSTLRLEETHKKIINWIYR